MGGAFSTAKSTTTAQKITDITTDVIQKSLNTCSATTTQDINVGGSNIYGDVSITGSKFGQTAQLDISCSMKTLKSADISSKISDDIAQKVKSEVAGGLGSTSISESITNLSDTVKTTLQQIDENKMAAQIAQSMNIQYDNVYGNLIIKDVDFTQSSNLVAKMITDNTSVANAINDVATKIDQQAESKTSGLSLTTIIIIAVVVLVIAGIIAGIYWWKSRQSVSQQFYPPPPPYGNYGPPSRRY